jgi:hypothetical protein
MASEDKQLALIQLVNGDDPAHIAKNLGLTLATVIRYKNELAKAEVDGNINTLIGLDAHVLEKMAGDAILDVPGELLPAATESADAIVSGVAGLQRLEGDLQATARQLNTRIRSMTMLAENVGEVSELTSALCKLQDTFFGKGTQVNVLNNFGGSEAYGQFLSDKPGA